ncbi:putative TFIIH subunit Ssl1/p44 protein [Rosa chinensis]|uniref:Putative TFIIH subunit Ssl1/p44 protein n=1 Tax=Rosa chinensis TaxID=74649 RepID=A0A2P6QHN1_ROSCH|nr:putative TFIIH subunit Ssl1/p44 protein [Rosa chinensis]
MVYVGYMDAKVFWKVAASEMDFRPSRMGVVAKHVEAFITEYFYQNPLSQVGLVTIKDAFIESISTRICSVK